MPFGNRRRNRVEQRGSRLRQQEKLFRIFRFSGPNVPTLERPQELRASRPTFADKKTRRRLRFGARRIRYLQLNKFRRHFRYIPPFSPAFANADVILDASAARVVTAALRKTLKFRRFGNTKIATKKRDLSNRAFSSSFRRLQTPKNQPFNAVQQRQPAKTAVATAAGNANAAATTAEPLNGIERK